MAIHATISLGTSQYLIPYFRDQTPRLLFISSRDFPRPPFEGGVYQIERLTGYTAMYNSSLNPFENRRSCLNTIEKPSFYNASCFLRGEVSKI